jgi:hypothetical protein
MLAPQIDAFAPRRKDGSNMSSSALIIVNLSPTARTTSAKRLMSTPLCLIATICFTGANFARSAAESLFVGTTL